MSEFLGIDLRQHCAHHPANCSAVERENRKLESKPVKCCEETGLNWTKAPPVVFMYMRMRQRAYVNLSPYEIMFGRCCDDDILHYCKNLSSLLSKISQHLKSSLPRAALASLHYIKLGDYIIFRDLKKKNWKSEMWNGLFQVHLVTHKAVKVAESYVHASHCRIAPEPYNDLSPSHR